MSRELDLKSRVAILVATAILPVFGLSIYKSWHDVAAQVETAKSNMKFAASLAAAQQGGIADAAKQLLGTIASNPAVTASEDATCAQLLVQLHNSFPSYSNIGLAGLDGRVRCDAAGSGGKVSIADRRYFREAVAGDTFAVGEYSVGRVTGAPVLVFAHPWKDSRGVVGGVVFASLTLVELFKDIGNAAMPAGGQLTILDRNGVVLSTNESRTAVGKSLANAQMSDAMRSGTTISGEISDGQSDRIFGLAPLPGASQASLYVRASVDKASVTTPTREVLADQLGVLLLVTLTAGMAAWTFGGRAIVAPADAQNARMLDEIRQLNAGLEGKIAARTADLQRANEELKAFSYSLSHDLRSPLKVIDGFAQQLQKHLDTGADAKVRHYLARIKAAVIQMGELIEGMLELNRVSHAALQWQDVDLSALAEDAVAQLALQDAQRVVQVTIAAGLHTSGDPRLLRAALQNLIGNAWKFTANQPQPEITFGSFIDDAGQRVLMVRDNGAGFDMNYSEKLFKAFERLHSSAEFPGTGVGLATVARVIARHGGRIWAESVPGEGATFFWTMSEVEVS